MNKTILWVAVAVVVTAIVTAMITKSNDKKDPAKLIAKGTTVSGTCEGKNCYAPSAPARVG